MLALAFIIAALVMFIVSAIQSTGEERLKCIGFALLAAAYIAARFVP